MGEEVSSISKNIIQYCSKCFLLSLLFVYFPILSGHTDEWTDIFLDVSYFEDDPYPVPNLFDGDLNTVFREDCIFIRLPLEEKITVNIFPGNGKSREEFFKYSRPKQIRYKILAGFHAEGFVTETATLFKGILYNEPKIFDLSDDFEVQSFGISLPLKEIENFVLQAEKKFSQDFSHEIIDKCIALKIEVKDVYPGSESQEVFVSELFTGDIYESDSGDRVKITGIFVNEGANSVIAETEDGKNIEVYSDPSSVLQLIEVSSNKQWAVVISMPAETEERVETEYLLIDPAKCEVVNEKIGALSGGVMYFGKPWAGLETLSCTGIYGQERKVYLK